MGYRIPFSSPPPLSRVPVPIPSYSPTSTKGKALRVEVLSLVEKGAVELAPPSPGYYSRLFVVWKATGLWRPVIYPSLLNRFVVHTWFKMETDQLVLCAVRMGDWMVFIDLKDVYLQVSVHPDSRRFLVCSGWTGLSFQSPMFWFFHGPSGVHQGHGSCVSHSSRPGSPDTLVSGRLVSPRLVQEGGLVGKGRNSEPLSPAWHHGQSGQVSPQSLSYSHVSWDIDREPLFEGFSLRRGFRPFGHSSPNFYPAGGKASLPGGAFCVVSPLFAFWCQGVGFVCAPFNWSSITIGISRTSLSWFLGLPRTSWTLCGGLTATTFSRVSLWRFSAPTYSSGPTPRMMGGAPICTTSSSRVVGRSRSPPSP